MDDTPARHNIQPQASLYMLYDDDHDFDGEGMTSIMYRILMKMKGVRIAVLPLEMHASEKDMQRESHLKMKKR